MSIHKEAPGANRAAVRAPGAIQPGHLSVNIERPCDIIVVQGEGLWTAEQMKAHLDEYRAALLQVRRPGKGARVVVLLEDTGVQLAAVTATLDQGLQRCHQAGDRIAMVVPSALARIQMRRVLDSDLHAYFPTEAEARAWLIAQQG